MNETVAILCDMHLSEDPGSFQSLWLRRAVEAIRRDGVRQVLVLGDVTEFGSLRAWELYCEALAGLEHLEIIGNSDVRDAATREELLLRTAEVEGRIGERRVIGLSTPDGEIGDADWARLSTARDGDVVLLHYYPEALREPDRTRFLELLSKRSLTVLHGHAHRDFDYVEGKSRVMGFRGLDPDKAGGDFPALEYLTFGERVERREVVLPCSREAVLSVREHLGVSCVDLFADVSYALEHGIGLIELRCDNKSWAYDPSLTPLLEEWRRKTGGFLSVHMPNLSWREGAVSGVEKWNAVLDYACLLHADHLTIHPPRRTSRLAVLEDRECFDALLSHYVRAVQRVDRSVTVGIENLHWDWGESDGEDRPFALVPEEVTLWIDAINDALGIPGRVGTVLDTGHARNNGRLAKKYPLRRWYREMGSRAVAYHLHQSVKEESGRLKNHKPLACWFGPMINYTGFFDAWERGILAHAPIFLEVKGWKNHETSLLGLDRVLEKL